MVSEHRRIPENPRQEALLQELAGIILVDADLTEFWRRVTATLAESDGSWEISLEILDDQGEEETSVAVYEQTSQLALVCDALRADSYESGLFWTALRIRAERQAEDLDRIGVTCDHLD